MKPILKVLFVLLTGTMIVFSGCGGDGDDKPCDGVTCQANASCVQGDCQCNTGFHLVGEDCVQDDPCDDVTCSDANSHCDNGDCVCNDGYEDQNGTCVEIVTDPCDGVTCDANEHCEDQAGTGVCVCDDGYHDEGGTCVEDTVEDCCGNGTLVGDVCQCDTGYNNDAGDDKCGPDTPAEWPPVDLEAFWNQEWNVDTAACNTLPACDECGGYPGDIVAGLPAGTTFTRTLTTTASDCNEALYTIDKRTEPGNVQDETGQSFGVMVGNCAQDLDGLHGGTFFDNIAASCSVNAPMGPTVPVRSVELGTLEYTANGGTGIAVIHVVGVQPLLGVPDCTIQMDVVYTAE